MFREIAHCFIAYRKRIGPYTVKVERINGRWWVWVLERTGSGTRVLMGDEMIRIATFEIALGKGLRFVAGHAG
ncbi:MAG: hypothetical protein GY832_26215 [Chloroflexi bacterium]|nr:hypothetical protein [Chloroflexota bacterium]